LNQSETRPEQEPIFVISKSGKSLAPTRRPGKVRHLLKDGKARIYCYEPFTIQLTYESIEFVPVEITLGIDPGSSDTPIAAEEHVPGSGICSIIYAKEILLRTDISAQLKRRSGVRRRRRGDKIRHRKPRFDNRVKSVCSVFGKKRTPKHWKKVNRKKGGKSLKKVENGRAAICRKCQHERVGEKGKHDADKILNPTLQNKVNAIVSEVKKLVEIMPVTKIRVELTAFDTQKMANPKIQGEEYQQGTLFGYEVKEYLLHKYGHKCVYCKGKSRNPVLEVEHVIPKKRGGTNIVSNLVIACETCNREKGSRTADEYSFPNIQKQAVKFRAFRYSALTQSYKWALWRELKKLGIPVEATFGYQTKYYRLKMRLPKAQVVDAMVIASGGRSFDLPTQCLIERRLKARKPFHRLSNENKKGKTCEKTPAMRQINGFRLYDKVSFVDGNGIRVYGYVTGLRTRGTFEVSHLEGNMISDKDWKKLKLEDHMYRNKLIEKRSIIGTILKTLKGKGIPKWIQERGCAGAPPHG